MALNIDPTMAMIPASGGVSIHVFSNPGEQRLVFKVRATNNDNYRVKPVYGFLEPQGTAQFEITRTAGPAKEDKFIVLFGAAQPEDADPEAAFKGTAQIGEVNLPCTAVDATVM